MIYGHCRPPSSSLLLCVWSQTDLLPHVMCCCCCAKSTHHDQFHALLLALEGKYQNKMQRVPQDSYKTMRVIINVSGLYISLEINVLLFVKPFLSIRILHTFYLYDDLRCKNFHLIYFYIIQNVFRWRVWKLSLPLLMGILMGNTENGCFTSWILKLSSEYWQKVCLILVTSLAGWFAK